MRGYPQFSFWVQIALAKSSFFQIVIKNILVLVRTVKGLWVTRDLGKKWRVTRESSSNIAVIREFAVQPDA